jgi:Ca2+-binding EF-hand superfamily protein
MTNRGFSVVAALGLATTLGFGGRAVAHGGMSSETRFQEMDSNSDGKVSEAEHSAWASQKFTRMDTNGDGKVSAAEMNAEHERAAPKATDKTEMSAEEKIRTIDTNGDGMLSKEEHEAGTVAKFTQMDTNKDGSLSKNEIKTGHSKMMSKSAAPASKK